MQDILISRRILSAALLLLGNAVFAHDDATLDRIRGTHGGQLRMAGSYHFELVVARDGMEGRDKPVTVYLTDHSDAKIPSAGTTGIATILAGKAKTSVALLPAGDNRLTGAGKYLADPQIKVLVAVTFPDGKTEQARFSPLTTVAPDAHRDPRQ